MINEVIVEIQLTNGNDLIGAQNVLSQHGCVVDGALDDSNFFEILCAILRRSWLCQEQSSCQERDEADSRHCPDKTCQWRWVDQMLSRQRPWAENGDGVENLGGNVLEKLELARPRRARFRPAERNPSLRLV